MFAEYDDEEEAKEACDHEHCAILDPQRNKYVLVSRCASVRGGGGVFVDS